MVRAGQEKDHGGVGQVLGRAGKDSGGSRQVLTFLFDAVLFKCKWVLYLSFCRDYNAIGMIELISEARGQRGVKDSKRKVKEDKIRRV